MIEILFFIACLTLGTFKWRRGVTRRQRHAARNALLAKSAYESMKPAQQERVMNRAIEILEKDTTWYDILSHLDAMPESARFGFFALAMNELDLHPTLSGENWRRVQNPFILLRGAGMSILTVQCDLQKKHGVTIELNSHKPRKKETWI